MTTFKGYKVGDKVKLLVAGLADLTKGKVYEVIAVGKISVSLRDDAGDKHAVKFSSVQPTCTVRVSVGYPPSPQAVGNSADILIKDDLDELTYDELKAAAPVTSAGIFKQGDVVVYRDGTTTNGTRTVTQCTATCVWFEETWSQPFNPNEFTVEDYY